MGMSDVADFAEETSARLDELDGELVRWMYKGQGSHLEYEPRLGEMRTRLAAAQERVKELTNADPKRQAEVREELAEDIRYLEEELRLAWTELDERTGEGS
jgi:hypothetical protein